MEANDPLLIAELRRDEGVRYSPYKDTVGIDTVGVGHNLKAKPLPSDTEYPLTDEQVDKILADDIAEVIQALNKAIPWWQSLTQARQRVVEVLNEIGRPQYGPRVTYTLSGGEKKLISLGTALAMRPRLLILDEPTAGLDDDAVLRLEKILLNSKLPYLIVSHDQEFLNRTVTSFMHLPPC